MSALVVLNPAARGGRARRARPALDAALARAGIEATVAETAGPGDAERIARDADAALVVAAGGDGTVHEVVNGLAGRGRGGPALGVLPLGTGDDVAAALGVPARLDRAVDALATPPVPIDLGRVRWDDAGGTHTRWFANCLGAGFDAHAARLARETKWIGGRAAYLAAVLRTLWAWRRPDVHVRIAVDGVPAFEGPLFLCETGNGHSVGGGFLLTPDARPDDGALDVCVVRHLPPSRAVRLLPRSLDGSHVGAPEVTTCRGGQVEIDVRDGVVALQADGEALTFGAGRVEIAVAPGAIRAVAPGLAAPPAPRTGETQEAVAERGYNS